MRERIKSRQILVIIFDEGMRLPVRTECCPLWRRAFSEGGRRIEGSLGFCILGGMETVLEESEKRLAALEKALSEELVDCFDGRREGLSQRGEECRKTAEDVISEAKEIGSMLRDFMDLNTLTEFEKELEKLEAKEEDVGRVRERCEEDGNERKETAEWTRERAESVAPRGVVSGVNMEKGGGTRHSVRCVFRCGKQYCCKLCRKDDAERHSRVCPAQKRKMLQKQLTQASDLW